MSYLPTTKTIPKPVIIPVRWITLDTIAFLVDLVSTPGLKARHRIIIFPDLRPPALLQSRKEAQEACALYIVDSVNPDTQPVDNRKEAQL